MQIAMARGSNPKWTKRWLQTQGHMSLSLLLSLASASHDPRSHSQKPKPQKTKHGRSFTTLIWPSTKKKEEEKKKQTKPNPLLDKNPICQSSLTIFNDKVTQSSNKQSLQSSCDWDEEKEKKIHTRTSLLTILVYTFLFTATASSSSSLSSFFEKEGKRHKKKAIGNVLLTPSLSSLQLPQRRRRRGRPLTLVPHDCPLPAEQWLFSFSFFLFFWRVLASLINMLSAQTNEFFEKKMALISSAFFFNFMTKRIWRIFKKRKEKYSRIYTLTIPKFPFLAQKGRIKHWPIIKVQL